MVLPSVTVVMATHNRPGFIRVAVRCFAAQTWPRRELIVVDDGDRYPADCDVIEQAGGKLLVVNPGTPLGTKLNLGASMATGDILCKWDDDDWYAPAFLEVMTTTLVSRGKLQPMVAFLQPFRFFILHRWQIRRSDPHRCSGSTFTLPRYLWRECPFRSVPCEVDAWFLIDLLNHGIQAIPLQEEDLFLQVRHDRHLWTHMPDGTPMDVYLERCEQLSLRPEDCLPSWAVTTYQRITEGYYPIA
jgi:glycosyltransferase involved in cell wall biosynthesis